MTMTEISTKHTIITHNKIIGIAITEILTQEGTMRLLQTKLYLFTKIFCI